MASDRRIFRCTQKYRMRRIGIRSRSTPGFFGFTLPKPRTINLIVSFKHVYNSWIQYQDSTDLQLIDVDIPTYPIVKSSIELTREQLFSSKLARRIIRQRTKDWLPRNSIFKKFVRTSLEKARKALKSIPKEHDTLFIDIPLVLVHDHVFPERSVRIHGDQDEGMTPASYSSIESLEDRVASDCDGNCAICLEDYDGSNGSSVSMPCSHVFHGGCIKKWLRKSRLCPICRFEMPEQIGEELHVVNLRCPIR